jgi:hypothetical protein
LAVALLFDEKIRQCVALFWFGLQDVGILYSQAVIQRTIDVSSAFLEHGRKAGFQTKQAGGWIHLHEAAQNFELLSNIQDQK